MKSIMLRTPVESTILNFKNDAVAGVERCGKWCGLHHIGFHTESRAKSMRGGRGPRDDVNAALGGGPRPAFGLIAR